MTHIAQICLDPSILDESSETFQRHLAYAETLAQLAPTTSLTIFSFAKTNLPKKQFKNLTLIPIKGKFETSFPALWRALNNLHKKNKIDLLTSQTVHQDGWFGLLWGKFHQVKILGQIHYDIFSAHLAKGWNPALRPLYWLRHQISLLLLPCYYALRTVNSKNCQQILQKYKIPAAAIPVAMSILNKEAPTNTIRTKTIIFVGRLSDEKNPFLWLECAHAIADQNPDTKFIMAGDGALRTALEQKAKDLHLPVHFTGFVSPDTLSTLYAESRLLLTTSYYEGFGRVIAEAMSYGLPVVSTKTAGTDDIIANGENGFIGSTPNELISYANQLLQDDNLFQSFSAKARQTGQMRFSFDHLKEEWARFLLDTAGSSLYTDL